jgi:hypothetical protein
MASTGDQGLGRLGDFFAEWADGMVWKPSSLVGGPSSLRYAGTSAGGDELFDGLEDELELLVVVGVFFLEGFDFLGQERIGIHQPPELHEGAHDGDVHLHRALGPQHAGKHGDALLGEGVGEIGPATVFPRNHHILF